MGQSSYGGLDVGDVTSVQRDKYDLVIENTRNVLQFAREGGVILGRNGALILTDHPQTLNVRLDAPVQYRIERAARETGIGVERAARRQKREDQIRAQMSLELYGWDPRGLDHYDLVLNTAHVTLDTSIDIIVEAARIKSAREG